MLVVVPRKRPNAKICYIHFPRTGGFSFYSYAQQWGDVKFYEEHAPKSFLPDEHSDAKFVSSIRNPLHWYVSYFSFFSQGGNFPPLNVFELPSISVSTDTEDDTNLDLLGFGLDRTGIKCPFVNALTFGYKFGFNCFVNGALNLKEFFTQNPEMHRYLLMEFKYAIKHPEKYYSWYRLWFANDNDVDEKLAIDNLDMSLMEWYINILGIDSDVEIFKSENLDSVARGLFMTSAIDRVTRHKSTHSAPIDYWNPQTFEKLLKSESRIIEEFYPELTKTEVR